LEQACEQLSDYSLPCIDVLCVCVFACRPIFFDPEAEAEKRRQREEALKKARSQLLQQSRERELAQAAELAVKSKIKHGEAGYRWHASIPMVRLPAWNHGGCAVACIVLGGVLLHPSPCPLARFLDLLLFAHQLMFLCGLFLLLPTLPW
jgi:hypothetical protein